jgi:hypothetical protein
MRTAWSGAIITVEQDSGTSHSLGIALKGGASSYFSADGSATSTVTSEDDNIQSGYTNEAIYNGVNYRLENEVATGPGCGGVLGSKWRPIGYYATIDSKYTKSVSHIEGQRS